MPINDLLRELRRDPAFTRNVKTWDRIPPRPARYADFKKRPLAELVEAEPVEASVAELVEAAVVEAAVVEAAVVEAAVVEAAVVEADLVEALCRRGTWPLYTHQAKAVRLALEGKNLVVVTGTASGKTLCYDLPVLQKLRSDPAASALYLFPTKALAQDQLANLNQLIGGLTGYHPAANLYDGDTPSGRRSSMRNAGGILLTNPDMLHAGILPHHPRWARLFASLKFVVLDEIHIYRGVFGSHVSNLLRRLRRICSLYGSDPIFICTSATIANPAEHAEALIEAPVVVVGEDDDGSPRGERHFLLVNPPMVNPALGIRQSALSTGVQIAKEFLQRNLQTVLFARSRLTTEWLLAALREVMPDLPPDRLQGYRGGYLPNERRSIERGLREGEVLGVAATNALELGVDIGGLSACVMVGYPGSIASTWQQAGRAGRRLESAVAILVASANPLDQYIINHPRFILRSSPERALINPDNLVILTNHIKCAAYELPFRVGESFGRSALGDEILAFLSQLGFLHRDQETYHWIEESYPAASVSLRSGSSQTVVIQDVSTPGRPVVIGQMEQESAPLLLYEGAIYPHLGESYLVERLDWEGCRADVRPVSVEYVTRAMTSSSVEVLHVEESGPDGPVEKAHGLVRVTEQATAYRKIKRNSMETLGYGEINLPPQVLETTAYWFTLPDELARRLEQEGVLPAPLDYGPNWPAQKQKALARDNGRCKHCGMREPPGRRHDVHHIQPFRTFGYISGVNENYKIANALDNLVTLCQACHRRAESAVRLRSSLAGLAGVMRNLAPLFLMCDPNDIFVISGSAGPQAIGPMVMIYERIPAGVGFSRQLYELHRDLLAAAGELVQSCPCLDGCPACVGPPGEVGPETKAATLQLIEEITNI